MLMNKDYWPGVDMVVVNYQTPGDLDGFLSSYQAANLDVPHSLHVVNVQPTEADVDVVEHWANFFPFLYTSHDENVGYARACNSAVAIPDRECVAFFNADTRLDIGVVEECHGTLMERPDWGVLGPRQVDDFCRITAGGIFGTREAPSFDGRWMDLDRGQYNDVRDDCVSISGSAYFIKRSVWDSLTNCPHYQSVPNMETPVGAFLPTPHYYEETYCSYHAIEHGYKVVYYGPARMVHRWHNASPVGGYAEKVMPQSRELFRRACDWHGIPHD